MDDPACVCVCTCMCASVRVSLFSVCFAGTVCLSEDKEDGGWRGGLSGSLAKRFSSLVCAVGAL